MTYRPVAPTEHSGTGRRPDPIPDALIAQLEHSKNTGAKCVINLEEMPYDERPSPEERAAFKRLISKAAYRYFPDSTVHKRFTDREIRFWVSPKRGSGGNS